MRTIEADDDSESPDLSPNSMQSRYHSILAKFEREYFQPLFGGPGPKRGREGGGEDDTDIHGNLLETELTSPSRASKESSVSHSREKL
jgi:hypothetical protein